MAGNRRTSALHYGHMGTATYRGGHWEFLRREPLGNLMPGADHLLKVQSPSRMVIPPSKSESAYDQSTYDLLAFGHAGSESGPVPIAICASGDHGDSVKFVRLSSEDVALDDGERLKVPRIEESNAGWWTGSGAPVQQIVCADAEAEATSVAIRLPSSTTIIRPLLRDQAVPATSMNDSERLRTYPRSRLDANPVITIPIDWTGGRSHADVTFDPRDESVIALVDVLGEWSVWSVEDRPPNSADDGHVWKGVLGASGSLHSDTNLNTAGSSSLDERWASVVWIYEDTSQSKLLVCDRHKIVLHSFHDEEIETTDFGEGLNLRGDSHWILDVKRNGANPSQLFVLTTTDLYCLSSSSHEGQDDVSILLSYKHYLATGNANLRLSLTPRGFGSFIFVYSRTNPQVLAFHFSMDHSTNQPCISDPTILKPPHVSDAKASHSNTGSPLTFVFRALHFEKVARMTRSSKGVEKNKCHLFKSFVLGKDLSVEETLYTSLQDSLVMEDGQDHYDMISFPPRIGLRAKEDLAAPDDFIVDDEDDVEYDTTVKPEASIQARDNDQERDFRRNWTVNFEAVYQAVVDGTDKNSNLTGNSEGTQEIKDALDSIQEKLEDNMQDVATLPLLSELLESTPYISDIDQDSQTLNSFIENLSSSHRLNLSYPPDPTDPPSSTLSTIYDHLVQTYLVPLAASTPDRIRASKERLLRSLAADLAIASTTIPLTPPLPKTITLPIHPKPTITELNRTTSPPPATSQISSTPAPTSTKPPNPASSLATLAKYTTLPSPLPTLSPTASTILSHWTPHANPHSYSYRHTTARLAADEALTSLPAEERERAIRRAAREERTRREKELQSQRMVLSSQVAPVVGVGGGRLLGDGDGGSRDGGATGGEVGGMMLPPDGRRQDMKSKGKAREKKRKAGF